MSKRRCPFTDTQQPVKKQETCLGSKGRQILSSSSERALQLLFSGAANQLKTRDTKPDIASIGTYKCSQCKQMEECEIKCHYCDKLVCNDCTECCNQCEGDYCKNCIFSLPEKGYFVCYSCY